MIKKPHILGIVGVMFALAQANATGEDDMARHTISFS